MCSIRRCRVDSCDGACLKPKAIREGLMNLLPNFKILIGKKMHLKRKSAIILEKSRANKNLSVVSFPDTYNECQAMVKEFDTLIDNAIVSDAQISIETLLERPAMIASALIEGGFGDGDARRSVFLIQKILQHNF